VRHGDVCWVQSPDRSGRRPALILTRSSAIGYLNAITVAQVTTTIRGTPAEVLLVESDGMPQRCVASLDNLQTVRKAHFGPLIVHLSAERMRQVRSALEFALGFNEMR
jgi:mRNA interferase MazF